MKPCASVRGAIPLGRVRATLALLGGILLAGCAAHPTHPATAAPKAPAEATAAPAVPVASHGDPEQRFKDALQLMKDKKTEEAQQAFESLATDFPQYSGPQTDLGILYARGKQKDKALASFNKAVADNPANATAFDWLGILYRENNAYANAEQAYLKSIAAQPNDASAHFNLGILYDVYLKRPADALAQYRAYQKIAGNDTVIVSAWVKEIEPPAPDHPDVAVPAATTPAAASANAPTVKP